MPTRKRKQGTLKKRRPRRPKGYGLKWNFRGSKIQKGKLKRARTRNKAFEDGSFLRGMSKRGRLKRTTGPRYYGKLKIPRAVPRARRPGVAKRWNI